MMVPDRWPKPRPGQLAIRCERGWGNGWYLYDHDGRVFTSGSLYFCLWQRAQLSDQTSRPA